MREWLSDSPDNINSGNQIQLPRRDFLKFMALLTGTTAVGAIAAYYRWPDIKQLMKDLLANNPTLYGSASLLDEYGLQLLGMPTAVTLYPYDKANIASAAEPDKKHIADINSFQKAVDLFQAFPRVRLKRNQVTEDETNLSFTSFHLPEYITRNKYIRAVCGIDLPTSSGETLPDHALAMQVIPPVGIVPILAPTVPVPNRNNINPATARYNAGDYRNLGLPKFLYLQTLISSGHNGTETQVVPKAERMVIKGRDVKGTDFAEGKISPDTIYMSTKGTNWGLRSWPDQRLLKDSTSCARMFWNLNPIASNGKREFVPTPEILSSNQYALQFGYLNYLDWGTQYPQIGPTSVFRTDQKTGVNDIIFIAPFLSITAPHIFHDIVMNTPVERNQGASAPDNLLIACGDVKYSTMYGFYPSVLVQQNGKRRIFNTDNHVVFGEKEKISDYFSMNNSFALYLGTNN